MQTVGLKGNMRNYSAFFILTIGLNIKTEKFLSEIEKIEWAECDYFHLELLNNEVSKEKLR